MAKQSALKSRLQKNVRHKPPDFPFHLREHTYRDGQKSKSPTPTVSYVIEIFRELCNRK